MMFRLVVKAEDLDKAREYARGELSYVNDAYYSVAHGGNFSVNEYTVDVFADECVETAILHSLQKWFNKDLKVEPPFEFGSLLWWRTGRKTQHTGERDIP